MTSRKKWLTLISFLLILTLILVACERPLPSDGSGDAPEPATYPGSETGEAYPSAPESDEAEPGYPAPETELVEPSEEDSASTEDSSGQESEVVSEESSEGDAVAEEAAGEASESESAEADTVEGEASEGETAEGNVVEGESAESEAAEGEIAEGESVEGQAAEGESTAAEPLERTHIVGAGDTLYSIGLQYNMSWVAIAEANDIINPDSLYIGQELIIPDLSAEDTTEDTVESAPVTEEDNDAAATTDSSAESESGEIIHVVQSGENLYRISLKYGVNMMDVARANGLANFDTLAVGQELIIPAAEAQEEEAVEPAAEETPAQELSHVVQEGETVFGIAFKYGIAWTKLVEANEISSPYTLEAGQILVIPASE